MPDLDTTTPNAGRTGRRHRTAIVGLSCLLIVLLSAGVFVYLQKNNALSPVAIGGPFELVDQAGQTRTEDLLEDRYSMIYFGFTFCPDVCPLALQNMSSAIDQLEEEDPKLAAKVQPVFISVDPERDSVEALADYASFFHERLIALTGTPEQIAAVTKAYKVFYQKVNLEDSSEYLVDHSLYVYVMGPEGTYRTHFTHQTSAQEIAELLRGLED